MNLNDLQEDIANYNTRNNLDIDPQSRLIDLYSEIGELSKEILKSSDYGKNEVNLTAEWDHELADCFYTLLSLANETGVNLERSLVEVRQKYQQRIDEKGSAGSG